MNIERLRFFVDLAVSLSYTQTAEQLFTTQGNVSKQIIALEKEMDITLFIREHRTIILSEAGRTLLPYAEQMLRNYFELQNELQPYRHESKPMLKISAIPVMVHYKATRALADFHHSHPHILLNIKEVESIHLIRELEEGLCDIAFVRSFELNPEKYEQITLEQDEFAVALPKNHVLAQKDKIILHELKNEQFYQLDQHTQLYEPFCSLCLKAGFTPKIGYKGTRVDTILRFVSNGMGVSILMRNVIEEEKHPGVAVIPLEYSYKSELSFLRLKLEKHSQVSNCFWEYMKALKVKILELQ